MKVDVLLPYTKLPLARDVVLSNPGAFVPHFAHCAEPFDYAEAIADRWLAARSFLIVEHDIAATFYQLHELRSCDYPWCAFAYDYPDRQAAIAGLGLVKFDARLVYATADIVDDLPRLRWNQLDDYIARVLRRRGYTRHVHGVVEHLRAA